MDKANEVGGAGRLMEIVGILRRHNLISGVTPPKLRAIVEELGPTYVKLGQMMSMRTDILPSAYCEELQKLRSDVSPMPADEVERVIQTSLNCKLGEVFPTFDRTPLGSASIAQAHRATLTDGSAVVVKVQREGIHEKMASDLVLLRKAARLLKLTPTGETIDFNMVLDEMWVVSQQEMDFLHEAENAEEFRRLNADITYVDCPKIYHEVSTRQVLVMEAIDGLSIDDMSGLRASGYDLAEITRKICVNYMKQILDDGFFHADPHPGNLRIRDGQIIWLDLGMVGRLSARDQRAFRKAIGAAATRDVGAMTDAVLSISRHTAPVSRETLYADVDAMLTAYLEMDIGSMNLGELMQQVLELAKKHGLSLPSGVTMLARGVSTLEGLIANLDPDINLIELLSQRFAQDKMHDLDWKQTALHSARALYESAQKSLSTPALVNDALRAALKGELKCKIETLPGPGVSEAKERSSQRLNHTLLYCAGILGASILALAPVEPRCFGLPWPSVAGFALIGLFATARSFQNWKHRRRR